MTPTTIAVLVRRRRRHGADRFVEQRIEAARRWSRSASRRGPRACSGTDGAPSRRPAATRRPTATGAPPRGRDRDCRRLRGARRGSRVAPLDVLRDLPPQPQARLFELARRLPVFREVLLDLLVLLGDLLLELLDVGRLERRGRTVGGASSRRRYSPTSGGRRPSRGCRALYRTCQAVTGVFGGADASNLKSSLPSFIAIVTVPPPSSRPNRISSVSGSRTSVWMTRASGRAP